MFNNIVVSADTLPEIGEIIEGLECSIEQHGVAFVADLAELLGVVPSLTDVKYGWRTFKNISITRREDNRYILELPPPIKF